MRPLLVLALALAAAGCAATETSSDSRHLLVEGARSGKKNQKLVRTGSHSYTGRALRGHDEAVLEVDDEKVYDDFRANFARA